MTEAEFRKLVDDANARYAALTPYQKKAHDYAQRRSFVRGMCPSRMNFDEWCEVVDRILPDHVAVTSLNAPESDMSEVGTIKMRTPGGKPSSISVSRVAGGQVDIHVSRSSEGEALIRLPASVARQLSDFLAKAGLPPAPEKDETHSCYDDAMFNAGVTHTVELLAKAIGATGWVAGDGSEDYDSDLQQTLMNILIAKGLYDDETGGYAALSQEKRHD